MRRTNGRPSALPHALLLGAGAVVALASLGACHDEPQARSKPAEEPFQLSPGGDDDAGAQAMPTEIPPPGSEAAGDAAAATPVAVADPGESGVRDCPTGKGPSDLIVKPEPIRRGADAGGAGGVVRVILDNRRSIPRTVEVTGIDRLDGVPGSPLKVSRVTADEGGGGFPQAKMMLAAQATMHLVVEFDPAVPPPYRVHFNVDDEAACIDSPVTTAPPGHPKGGTARPRGKKK